MTNRCSCGLRFSTTRGLHMHLGYRSGQPGHAADERAEWSA